jgi:hypothetical protein
MQLPTVKETKGTVASTIKAIDASDKESMKDSDGGSGGSDKPSTESKITDAMKARINKWRSKSTGKSD